ncbi:MAG TPA: conjugal transfer protein TraD [Allosphingosinicella sp.]|jgi:hypothetical protein|nr:conjugal transfer protein TraD [Allosphingosinicella sp.]
MRKPRDYDSELKALSDRARVLQERRLRQLGELVVATRADTLLIDVLAGVLLSAAEQKDPRALEGWRAKGTSFFRRSRNAAPGAAPGGLSVATDAGGTLPLGDPPRT